MTESAAAVPGHSDLPGPAVGPDQPDLRAAFAALCRADPAGAETGEAFPQALARAVGACFARSSLALRGIGAGCPTEEAARDG